MAKLSDIRGCKIMVGDFSWFNAQSLLEVAADMGVIINGIDSDATYLFVGLDGVLYCKGDISYFNGFNYEEIFFYDGAFHDCEKLFPVNTGNAIHAALDYQPGDIVFNKNGFKYKQFLCLHPLDSNVSLCQCDSGDILEVLNSELLSYSENLAIIKAETDNAKKLYDEYVKCVNVKNPMAVMIPFENMNIEGIKIWIEFSKRVTINEK